MVKKVVSFFWVCVLKAQKSLFLGRFFHTPYRFSQVKCLVGFQQSKFLLLIIKKKFLNFNFDLHTQGTLYRILKQGNFSLNCVIFGLLLHQSMFIDENDRKLTKKNYFWACETSKTSLSQSFEKFGLRKKCSIFRLLTTQQRTFSLKRVLKR